MRASQESPLSGSILEFKLHSMPKPLDITYTFINNVPSQKIDSLQSRDPNDLRCALLIVSDCAYVIVTDLSFTTSGIPRSGM